ncbi:hypothetical protein [Chryseolinea serpens]|uniref:hypothetical protein n=1 Tax=Chryseolinea serpens TaxID=947013 RepID=UPI000935494A|nr:hypothetical protein [Chryseolinea serpens]
MGLVLSWDSLELRAICENELEAKQKLGMQVASILQTRLAELVAATTISDLLVGNPTPFPDSTGEVVYKINLGRDHELFFGNAHPNPPMIEDLLDWTRIRRIKILSIHEKNGTNE